MTELLFLLLPLAFYSGWKAAKKNKIKQSIKSNKLADDYVKGVNYLLSEKPDKALEVFISHPNVDEYTAETYLLLGNMFRNRGEVDRALRLHQNLIARSSLNKTQKSLVMFALGEDYFAAGILDRAEAVFKELLEINPEDVNACSLLRQIYEQTHEWEKAIHAVNCLKQKNLPETYQKLMAHYYCEMADQRMIQGNLHKVDEYLYKASQCFKASTRVLILQADLLQRKKNYKKAFRLYLKVLEKDSNLLSYLFSRLTTVTAIIEKNKELEVFLFDLYTKDSKALNYLLEFILLNRTSNNISIDFLIDDLAEKKLDIYSIRKSIDILLQKDLQLCKENEKLPLIKCALDKYLQGKASFQCQNCGYRMRDYIWRCPACYQWDKIAHL